ncbi:MAG: PHP domain-containing protein [Candidatus Phytoplasma stylosanthis]|uniref:exonuclease domain-containing protein n=1 Tax=Candidatus Phytoplasma stylosanthis TaxID=2798314 RepID=UPI00293A0660|nr:exonuclease domain-containing protein [Candidatus Phytoplasma stylosanthis]MDV3167972.1 PHP domain-containing protein [Candidatus Phytoplasma stylosanthis]MDV3174285.1 PHP domain-containing protein [Candidatus Phytoplasma stylosanthis]MDV3202738.1 PHP domain-containing protein [Candidatus Phytoplasma stylosanthis]
MSLKKDNKKFDLFLKSFNDARSTHYELKEVFVYKKKEKWVLNIFFKKKDIDFLEQFEQEALEFLKEKIEIVENLEIDFDFLFLRFNGILDEELWIRIFKYLLKKIILKKEQYNANFLSFEIKEVDFCKKICRINFKNGNSEILELIINDFEQLLKKEYGFNLEFSVEKDKGIKIEPLYNKKNYLKFSDIPYSFAEVREFKEKYNFFWIKGYIQNLTKKETQNKHILLSFYLIDPDTKNDSIFYKNFWNPHNEKYKILEKDFQEGVKVEILSSLEENNYKKEDFFFKQTDLTEYQVLDHTPFHLKRKDDYSGQKRIEFHVQTKMSDLDSVTSAANYIEIAERWGHKAIAFTDYNGLYAYPEINNYIKNKKIKPILGVKIDFLEENPIFVTNQEKNLHFENFILKQHNYVVFDIETTGLSKTRDKIIEISAIKIENGELTEKIFDQLIDPQTEINEKITELTKIKNEDLKNKPLINEVLPNFLKFIEGYVLVAHNYSFDIGFLNEKAKDLKLSFKEYPFIDTLSLSQKYFNEDLKFYRLKNLAKLFKIKTEFFDDNYHRALFDSKITASVLLKMFDQLEKRQIVSFYDLKGPINGIFEKTYNVNLLVRNQKGYQNLFFLVSDALTKNFYKKPRLLKTIFEKNREGLLIGSSSYQGNVFEVALNQNDEELRKVISFYDYIEIQPVNCYKHIIYDLTGDNEQEGRKIIQEILLKIIKESRKQNKIVIATGEVHYLHPYEKIYREIYINAKLVGGGLHRLSKYKSKNLPDNYFLTTKEMLDSFDFIKDQKLREDLVIHNTHLLNDKIERIKMFPQKLFSLKDNTFLNNLNIKSIRKEINNLVQKKLKELYGEHLHPLVEKRINKELKSIIGDKDKKNVNNNISPIYFLAYLLAKKSIDNDYPVGSRGSIGSSFVATLLEITEVNPLKPHYLCSKCQYTVFPQMYQEQKEDESFKKYIKKYIKNNKNDFNDYSSEMNILSGYDLSNKNCPFCNKKFSKNGQDIPFETFLGFQGNKIPDIDLNFAGDFQSKAHDYMKELLGEDYVFRAGTIQTVAQKTAFGYVKGFIKDKDLINKIRNCEISRRSSIIEGVKRSTGQHPGGIVVVPKKNSIYEITPIQFPANDTLSSWKTTHFDYHSFENNLFKMDILGHDDPILIKFFMDYVHNNREKFPFYSYRDIPVDDPEVYKLFSNEIKISNQKEITTIAIPEFGTEFVKTMLKDIYQKEKNKFNFGTLVKISGLSHGTDVWIKNGKDILNQKGDFTFSKGEKVFFKDIIGCRDDIMLYLIKKNIDPLKAFEIMELVRKGQQNSDIKTWNEKISLIKENTKIPDWYFQSLTKIKYLFPKAHAAAYVLMAVRIAWFKVYHPLLFYSGIFTKRLEQFDYKLMLKTSYEIDSKIKSLMKQNQKKKITYQEQSLINTLNVASEMLQRGFKFLPVDLNKSKAFEFVIYNDDSLIMPFIIIDGIGEIAANNIVNERNKKEFTQADFHKRIKVNKTVLKIITEELKLVDKLPIGDGLN